MNSGGKKWAAIIAAVLFVLCALWFAVRYGQYRVYIPYYWEMLVAPRSASPQEAYEKFYEALRADKMSKAVRYLSREERAAFKQSLLEDPQYKQRQIDHKSELRELYTVACDEEALCRQFAVYEYEYEIKEAYLDSAGGEEFLVAPGSQTLEMKFIQLPGGAWQISQL